MSRQSPALTGISAHQDGSLRIEWDLDRFFPDPEEPDEIAVEFGQWTSEALPGNTRRYDVPKDIMLAFAGARAVPGHVVFIWRGPPDDVKRSGFVIAVPGDGEGPAAEEHGLRSPSVQVVARHPKTVHQANRMTLRWSSYNYTHGKIIWGPEGDPSRHTWNMSRPRSTYAGVDYSGEFTTDQPLSPRTTYHFAVRVENRFESRTAETSITAVAAENFRSVRQFLTASGEPLPTGLRRYLPEASSLRFWLGV